MATKLTTAQRIVKAAEEYKEVENAEVIPSDFNAENVRIQIADTLGVDAEDVEVSENEYGLTSFNEGQAYTVETEGVTYNVVENVETAENIAFASILQNLKDEPETYLGDWAYNYIDESEAEALFTEMYNEWNKGYATDIMDEADDEYENRLVQEMVETELVSAEEAKAEDFDPASKLEEFIENMTQRQLDEGQGGYDHYESNFGEEEARKLVVKHGLIDLDAAADYANTTDGWAHELSRYDGESDETADGFVFWRED